MTLRFLALASLALPAFAEPSNNAYLADRPNSPEMMAIGSATGAEIHLKYVEAPAHLAKVQVSVAIYDGDGQESTTPGGPGMGPSVPPSIDPKVGICISARLKDPVEWDRTVAYSRPIPGTGSTELGYCIFESSVGGQGSTGSSIVIQHKDIDFFKTSGPYDCAKLPFKIETAATLQDHAIPVFAWFPTSFDLTAKREKLTTKDFPKGTIIIYAILNEQP